LVIADIRADLCGRASPPCRCGPGAGICAPASSSPTRSTSQWGRAPQRLANQELIPHRDYVFSADHPRALFGKEIGRDVIEQVCALTFIAAGAAGLPIAWNVALIPPNVWLLGAAREAGAAFPTARKQLDSSSLSLGVLGRNHAASARTSSLLDQIRSEVRFAPATALAIPRRYVGICARLREQPMISAQQASGARVL